MFTGKTRMTLFKTIATSLHHGLNMQLKTLAGLGHDGPQKIEHHLRDLGHRWGSSTVLWGAFFYVPLRHAPDILIQSITFRAAEWPNLI